MLFGIPAEDFVMNVVLGIPATIGMIYAAITVKPDQEN